jgi:hypothetical protein
MTPIIPGPRNGEQARRQTLRGQTPPRHRRYWRSCDPEVPGPYHLGERYHVVQTIEGHSCECHADTFHPMEYDTPLVARGGAITFAT